MKKGFTLIELLVVISILGLLSGLLIVNVGGVRERARDSQRKSDLYQIKEALKLYHNDHDDYPESPTVEGFDSYIKQLPADPSTSENYSYDRISADDFTLFAVLENESDAEIGRSQSRCSITGQEDTRQYYICAD